MSEPKKLFTEGQYRVGISFNPSNNDDVNYIKSVVAEIIDFITEHGKDSRCTSIACTELESAAMWAVKSITKQENPNA